MVQSPVRLWRTKISVNGTRWPTGSSRVPATTPRRPDTAIGDAIRECAASSIILRIRLAAPGLRAVYQARDSANSAMASGCQSSRFLFVPGMTFGQVVELPHGILVRDTLNALHPRLDRLDRIFGRIKTIAQHMLENVFR